MKALEQGILADLPQAAPAKSAVVFDVDATLLSDFDFEEATHYNYDAAVSASWVSGHLYPAVAGMPDLLRTLKARGYDIQAVTGRPATQEADTVANLTEQGFTTTGGTPIFTADNVTTTGSYTPAAKPAYVDCAADGNAASCSTVEKKAFTRKNIEDSQRLERRPQRGRPVERPDGRLRRRHRQAAEPDVLPGQPRHRRRPGERQHDEAADVVHDEARRLQRYDGRQW